MAGLEFFKTAVALEKEFVNADNCRLENAFQTNGLLIDDEWAEFFAEQDFLVGISLDGDKDLHDSMRRDCGGNGTFERVMDAISILQKHNVKFNVLSVLTHKSCLAPKRLYDFFGSNNLVWQQYIPCLDPLNKAAGREEWSIKSGDYGRFLTVQFDLWYSAAISGMPTYNRYFDNILTVICGGQPEACDMRGICGNQLVVETNGRVYPCDFYCVDELCLGNFNTDTLGKIEKKREELEFVKYSAYRDTQCSRCKWFKLCRGGCRRHRTSGLDNAGAANRNRFCEDYKMFFEYAYPRLLHLAEFILKKQE